MSLEDDLDLLVQGYELELLVQDIEEDVELLALRAMMRGASDAD